MKNHNMCGREICICISDRTLSWRTKEILGIFDLDTATLSSTRGIF